MLFFRPLQFANVTRYFRRADNSTLAAPDQRDGQRNIESSPILRLPYGLEVFDLFAAADSREDIIFFRETLGRNDQGDALTDRLCRAVPEYSLCGPIPRSNNSVQSLADYGVVRRIDDRCK